MDNMPDWSVLLPDLLIGIALRLPIMEDFAAFRGVCSNWRAAGVIKGDLFKGVSKVPLLLLSEKDDSDEREFYSFVKRKIFFTMPVPGAKGQRCMDAGFGWILAMSSTSVGEICLFDPFSSSAKIELPNFQTFPGYEDFITGPEWLFIRRGRLSANPSVTSNFTVSVVVNGFLGFWRNGDKNWTKINVCWNIDWGSSCYYKGKLYAINVNGEIYVWDPYGSDPTKASIILLWDESLVCHNEMPYLVESSEGELLVILRNNVVDNTIQLDTGATYFGMMRVDLVEMECKEINGLGKDAVFLGDNATTSVAADEFPGVKPNCIYFTDDRRYPLLGVDDGEEEDIMYLKGGGKDMGIYNVEDGSIERFGVECFSKVCPPLWIFPSF